MESYSKRILDSIKRLKECDASMGDAHGAVDMAGGDNSTQTGTLVHRGVKRRTKARNILQSLKIMEAEQETNSPEDDKVVAQVVQNVTAGDVKNASRAAKLLADAGKLDKNTADEINKKLDKLQ